MTAIEHRDAALGSHPEALAAMSLSSGLGQSAVAARPVRYVITDLGTLGGSFSGSGGLNNRGEVTGISFIPGDTALRGFVWRDGHLSDVGTLGGPQAAAGDINESGQFVGWSNTTAPAPPSIFNQFRVLHPTNGGRRTNPRVSPSCRTTAGRSTSEPWVATTAPPSKKHQHAGQVVGVAEMRSTRRPRAAH